MNDAVTTIELNGWQAKMFRILMLTVPLFLTMATVIVIPLSIWLIQNAYMAQETARLVAATAMTVKDLQEEIRSLPPMDWRVRIQSLEQDSKENLRDHNDIKIALEQIKVALEKN